MGEFLVVLVLWIMSGIIMRIIERALGNEYKF